MDRQIKFKGKSVFTHEWLYGNLLQTSSGYCLIDPFVETLKNRESVDPQTVCEFTGELDRDKEELYECDLFQIGNEPGIYEIRFEHGCFLAYHDGKQYGLVGELANCFIKKIGNIFENQELLQQ